MQVSSKELSEELYKLSGWANTTEYYHPKSVYTDSRNSDLSICPAYDLAYLLEKLPFSEDGGGMSFAFAKDKDHWYFNFILTGIRGPKMQSSFTSEADTPTDAACKLAIELFKAGVLKGK